MPFEISAGMVNDLLPRDLRGELCVAGLTLAKDRRALEFRMDPGHSFERRAVIRLGDDGPCQLLVADRFVPGAELDGALAIGSVAGADVPDQLRRLAGQAWTNSTARPHWRDAIAGRVPRLLHAWPGTDHVDAAACAASVFAQGEHVTCFVCWHSGRTECVTVPPPDCPGFLSVTPERGWSMHTGRDTYPLSGMPDTVTFATVFPFGLPEPKAVPEPRAVREVPEQVRLARRDNPGTGPPTVPPAQRGPTRTGSYPNREQGKRRRR
jgi:hypothetical protein